MDKELRLFIKLILLQEYTPKDIKYNMQDGSAFITMNSLKDTQDFLRKYSEYCSYKVPVFRIYPVNPQFMQQPMIPNQMYGNQFGMYPPMQDITTGFGNMSIFSIIKIK